MYILMKIISLIFNETLCVKLERIALLRKMGMINLWNSIIK